MRGKILLSMVILPHMKLSCNLGLFSKKKVEKNEKRNYSANVTPHRSIDGLGGLEWSGGKWRIKDSEAICRELDGGLMAIGKG